MRINHASDLWQTGSFFMSRRAACGRAARIARANALAGLAIGAQNHGGEFCAPISSPRRFALQRILSQPWGLIPTTPLQSRLPTTFHPTTYAREARLTRLNKASP